MSLADDKRNIFTTIGSYTSLIENDKKPLQTDLFPSINNKEDIVPFLLDVLKVVAGTEALKEAIGGMFTKVIGDVEPQLKETLKNQFIQSNAGDTLPSGFVSNGITVPVASIDPELKLKIPPASSAGNLVYNTAPNSNFDLVAFDAISSGAPKDFSVFTMQYNSSTDEMQVKPNVSTPTVAEFFTQYIDDAEIINSKEITTKVMDAVYGTLAATQGKTVAQNEEELKVSLQIEQMLNDREDAFTIAPEDLDAILDKATELSEGIVTYDMGCGLLEAELQFDDLDNMIKSVSGSTDPFFVGNQFEATIDQSTSGDTLTQTATEENKQTIKDGFFQKIINVFTVKLTEAVTTAPQIRVMLGMLSSIQNAGDTQLSEASEDMGNFESQIKEMGDDVMKIVAEFIFSMAAAYLAKMLKPVIIKILKEKINQYVKILKSLTPVGKILDKIT